MEVLTTSMVSPNTLKSKRRSTSSHSPSSTSTSSPSITTPTTRRSSSKIDNVSPSVLERTPMNTMGLSANLHFHDHDKENERTRIHRSRSKGAKRDNIYEKKNLNSTLMAMDMASDSDSDSDNGHDFKRQCSICTVDGQSVEGPEFDELPLIYCTHCKVGVHSVCYGNPLVLNDQEEGWTCERCKWGASDHSCALCPTTEGMSTTHHRCANIASHKYHFKCVVHHRAMKRTTDWRWAHLSCALWIPECFFRYGEGREPVDYSQLKKLPKRWGRKCEYCKLTDGVTVECSHERCKKVFHVSCGMKEKVFLEYKANNNGTDVIVTYCNKHAKKWRVKGSKGVIRAK